MDNCPKIDRKLHLLPLSSIFRGKTGKGIMEHFQNEKLALQRWTSTNKLPVIKALIHLKKRLKHRAFKQIYIDLRIECSQEYSDQIKEIYPSLAAAKVEVRDLVIELQNFKSNEPLTELGHDLQRHLIDLESITFRIKEMKSNNKHENIKELARYLLRCANKLKSIKLEFDATSKLTGLDINELCAEIKRSVNKLQQLTLSFIECDAVNDKSLQTLIPAIIHHPAHLTHLTLVCSWNESITDESLLLLGNEISKAPNRFQALAFNFTGCAKISSKGFSELLTGIKSQSASLKRLELNFGRCDKITNLEMRALGEAIPCLNQITKLNLVFNRCFSIKMEGIKQLITYLSMHSRQLQQLSCDFFWCDPDIWSARHTFDILLGFIPQRSLKL